MCTPFLDSAAGLGRRDTLCCHADPSRHSVYTAECFGIQGDALGPVPAFRLRRELAGGRDACDIRNGPGGKDLPDRDINTPLEDFRLNEGSDIEREKELAV